MKNKILLFLVVVLIIIYCLLRSFDNKTSFLVDNTISMKNKDTNEIEELNMEEYLVGVLAGEMPASFEMEALKAQAVASRTYAYYKVLTTNKDYDVTNDTSTQVHLTNDQMREKWQDQYEYYFDKIKMAIDETKDEVITYNGQIIPAYYFSMSNGYTESGMTVFGESGKYLNSVKSPEDTNHRNYEVITIYQKNEFCNALNIGCNNINISDISRNVANRVDRIKINNKEFTGIEVRKLLNLRSTDFNIEINEDNLTITTYGYGHGVGMSQYGANNMAKNDYDYLTILKHFYSGVEIESVMSIK